VKELLESGSTDAKTTAYLEGCNDLMKILSSAGSDKKSPIIKLRQSDDSKMAFFFFAREFLPCIVKRLFFRQKKLVNLLSDFVTVYDEAFTLFLLENNVARWNVMFLEGTKKSDNRMPPQKFQSLVTTGEKVGKDGYGLQAIIRYNEYYDSIEAARKNLDTESVEDELKKMMEALEDEGKCKTKKSKRKRDGELNYVDENGLHVKVRCDL
jgi:hypothetical protein